MADSRVWMRRLTSRQTRRLAITTSFWLMLGILLFSILQTYIITGEKQQSAYGDDWNDLNGFRDEVSNLGIETTALISSPLLLTEIDQPEQAIFVISGVERDTIYPNLQEMRVLLISERLMDIPVQKSLQLVILSTLAALFY